MKKKAAVVGVLLALALAVGAPLKFNKIAPDTKGNSPATSTVVVQSSPTP